jgi:hypothetical protein
MTTQPRRCEAFTKAFNPCRGYGDHHTHYYDVENCPQLFEKMLFTRKLFMKPVEWLTRLLGSMKTGKRWLGGRIELAYREAIGHNRMLRYRIEHIYTCCVYAGIVYPQDAPSLWMKEAKTTLFCFGGATTDLERREFPRRAAPYFVFNPETEWIERTNCLIFLNHLFCKWSSENVDGVYFWNKLLSLLLPYIASREMLFYDKETLAAQHFTDISRMSPETNTLRLLFMQHLHEQKVQLMETMKHTIAPLKEGLVAAAFHPDRINRYIQTYGIESMEDL